MMAATDDRTSPLPFIYVDEHHVMAGVGSALLTYSRSVPNPRYLAAWTLELNRRVSDLGAPISIVTVIDSRTRAPDETSKNTIRNTIMRNIKHIAAFVYVVEGDGFGAAAMRSTLALITLVARYPFPQKVFASIDEAGPWLRLQAPSGISRYPVDPSALVEMVDSMRMHLAPDLALLGNSASTRHQPSR
jgi:hypothetical protein